MVEKKLTAVSGWHSYCRHVKIRRLFICTHSLTFTLPIKPTVLSGLGRFWMQRLLCVLIRVSFFSSALKCVSLYQYITHRCPPTQRRVSVCRLCLGWWGYSVFVMHMVGDLWEWMVCGPLITARTHTLIPQRLNKCIFKSQPYCVVSKMETFLSLRAQARARVKLCLF